MIKTCMVQYTTLLINTVEPLMRGHPDERPTPLERPLNSVNLNKCIDIYP